MKTYSVFRLAARRTDRSVRDSVAGIRAGERKTCCAKPLPRPPGLWGLNAVPPFANAHSGRSAGQLGQASAAPNEPSSDQRNWDLAAQPPFSGVLGRRGASVATPN